MEFPLLKKICILFGFYLSVVTSGLESGNVTVFYIKYIIFSKSKDTFVQHLVLSFYCGSIIGALVFCLSKLKKKHFKILISADISIIIGSILMCSATANRVFQLLLGRTLVGLGLSLNLLSMPLLIDMTWPKNITILASAGFSFQIGIFISDSLSWLNWRLLISTIIWPTLAHIALVLLSTNSEDFDGLNEAGILTVIKGSGKSVFAALTVQVGANLMGLRVLTYIAPISVGELPKYLTGFSALGSMISIWVVRRFRRRLTVIASLLLIIIELAIMALLFPTCGRQVKISSICVYLLTVSASMASLPILYTLESFPQEHRAMGFGLVGFLTDLTLILFLLGFDHITKKASASQTLWYLCGVAIFVLILSCLLVRETKDSGSDPDSDPEPDFEPEPESNYTV